MPGDDIEEYRKDVRMLGARLVGEGLLASAITYALHQWQQSMRSGAGRLGAAATMLCCAGVALPSLIGAASLFVMIDRMRFDASERLDVGPISTTLFGPRHCNSGRAAYIAPPESVTLPWFLHDDIVNQYKARYKIK